MLGLVAGAWSLRDRYPQIDFSFTGPAKQVQSTRANVDQPAVNQPKERIVIKEPQRIVIKEPPTKPLPEWRPPLDTRSVVRTVPQQ